MVSTENKNVMQAVAIQPDGAIGGSDEGVRTLMRCDVCHYEVV